MLVGINHPWHQFGWDFGPFVEPFDRSQYHPGRWSDSVNFSAVSIHGRQLTRLVESQLDVYERAGIKAVRWFVLGDGWNLGTPTLSGGGEWEYAPPPLDNSTFVSDFEDLLKIFRNTGLQLLPVLVNHLLFAPGGFYLGRDKADRDHSVQMLGSYASVDEFVQEYYAGHPELTYDPGRAVDWRKFIKGAKMAVVKSVTAIDTFLDNVLQPLLNVSSRYSDQILAWELISEPDLAVSESYVAAPNMLEFVMRGVERILQNQFRATVGFQHQITLTQMWGSAKDVKILNGLTQASLFIPQVHYYPEYGDAPLSAVNAKDNYVVGEFATSFNDYGNNNKSWPAWPNEKSKSIAYRLRVLKDLKYASAFLWSANARDGVSNWDASVQDAVRNFRS